jgi:hypothetical protein
LLQEKELLLNRDIFITLPFFFPGFSFPILLPRKASDTCGNPFEAIKISEGNAELPPASLWMREAH